MKNNEPPKLLDCGFACSQFASLVFQSQFSSGKIRAETRHGSYTQT
jgi:hypothetical protein